MGRLKRPSVTPERLHSDAYAAVDDLRELGRECRERGVSERTRLLLGRLASYPPNVRLVVNLKMLTGLLVNGPVYNVLTEGLTPLEHAALVELDMKALSSRSREVAHGLLNIHERWRAMKEFRRMFKKAMVAKGCFISLNGQPEEEHAKKSSTSP